MFAYLSLAHALVLDDSSQGIVHGWTADGALVLEVVTRKGYYAEGSDSQEEGQMTWAVVIQGDKEIHRWLLSQQYPEFVKEKGTLQTNEWTTWRNSHPLTPASAARSSPGGVKLEVRAVGDEPVWAGDVCDVTGHRDAEESPVATVGLSQAGEGFWSLVKREIRTPSWQGHLPTHISARWAPDGRQVAVLLETATADTMRGPSYGQLEVVISKAAPLVGVLAPKTVSAAITDKVVAAVGPLGLVQKGEAQTARDSSVVYYASGYEADARAIAAKVPGGATVAPMDWKGAQHVVVAVGASAR